MSCPERFMNRLQSILPVHVFDDVVRTFSEPKPLVVRLNTIKSKLEDRESLASDSGRFLTWYGDARQTEYRKALDMPFQEALNEGRMYIQSASSLIPVLVLDPKPGEVVLDLCAAPGSKTSLMAAHMRNTGLIVANEPIRERYFRLKSVLNLLGCECVKTVSLDGRRFQNQHYVFDKILVDAPCSSEGRFKSYDKKSFQYWSLRKIREMRKKQRGLLLNACRLVRPGGIVVYATCTFAPEENEGVVDWVLRKCEGEISVEKISIDGVASYPALTQWLEKTFDDQVSGCLRVLPTDTMDGFFVAKLRRSDG